MSNASAAAEMVAGDESDRSAPAESFAEEKESRAESLDSKPRVLLVEDDFLVGMELEAGLRDAGCEVIGIAVSAEEAVILAERERPLLVVMDIRLSGERDGVDAALEIHRRLGIRSLFASAHGDADVRARAEAARPLGWIGKPYRVSALVAAVRNALDSIERGG